MKSTFVELRRSVLQTRHTCLRRDILNLAQARDDFQAPRRSLGLCVGTVSVHHPIFGHILQKCWRQSRRLRDAFGSQSKQFFPRNFSCRPIYGDGQFMCLYPNFQVLEIMHDVSSGFCQNQNSKMLRSQACSRLETRDSVLAALSEALHKILPRQLPHFPAQLQFEESSKNF
jgi:hypothetical protein